MARTTVIRHRIALAMLVLVACREHTYSGAGEVVAVDEPARRVRIKHDDIPGLLRAATMTFDVRSADLLAGVAVGHAVRFSLARSGEQLTVVRLEVVPEPGRGARGVRDQTPHHGGVVAFAGAAYLEAHASHDGVRVWVTDLWRRPLPLADVGGRVTIELPGGPRTYPLVVRTDVLEARTPALAGDSVRARVEITRAGDVLDVPFVLPLDAEHAGAALVPSAECAPPEERAGADRPRCVLGLGRPVTALATSPDGALALIATDDAGVTAWRMPEGRLTTGLAAPPPVEAQDEEGPDGVAATALALAPDGTQAAVALERRLLLYDVRSGARRADLPAPSGMVRSLAWSPDGGRLLVAAFGEPGVRLLTLAGPPRERRLEVEGEPAAVAFASDGRTAAVGTEAGPIVLFALDADPPAPRRLEGLTRPADAIAFAGGLLLSASADGVLRLWDVARGERVAEHDAGTPLLRLAVAGDGATAATAGLDLTIRVHDARTGVVRRTLAWHRSRIAGLAWAGDVLVSGDTEGWVAVWDAAALQRAPAIP
jgi:Cu/Ag efflux protein CusF